MKAEYFDITGMHCASCSAAIERGLNKLPGVGRAEVNLPLNRLYIEYDEELTDGKKITEKIESLGYSASPHKEERKKDKADKKPLNPEKALLILSSVCSALLLYISMGQMLWTNIPIPDFLNIHKNPFSSTAAEGVLALIVIILGKNFFVSGFRALFRGSPNMDTLVALSAAASFIYSVVCMITMKNSHQLPHSVYFESSAVVITLVSVGKYLERRSEKGTKGAVERLIALSPDKATVIDGFSLKEVDVDTVKKGDTIVIKAGERVPLDGVILYGTGSVDESMITGESLPAEKTVGSEVVGGTVALSGFLKARVTRVGEDTTLRKIIRFVEEAGGKKAPIARLADKISGVFVPIIIAVAVIASVIWYASGESLSFALRIFSTVLVIACPCALGLATPLAVVVGIGLAADRGILVRDAKALENARKITTAVFDKTGTVTKGQPTVTKILSLEGEKTTFTKILASAEKMSSHPLATAICREAEKQNIEADMEFSDFENSVGSGICAKTREGESLIIGNREFMSANNIPVSSLEREAQEEENRGATVIFAALGEKLLGFAALADTIRPESASVFSSLKKAGIKTVILTGDNQRTADYIGEKLGADRVYARLTPNIKASIIEELKNGGETVMMVGDGINDSPALTAADIGAAIGSGSDIAALSSDIILMNSNLESVLDLITISKKTVSNIKRNLFWAFFYNVLGVPVAAGLLYPSLGLLLSPMIGALAMSLSSLFVVFGSLSLKRAKIRD